MKLRLRENNSSLEEIILRWKDLIPQRQSGELDHLYMLVNDEMLPQQGIAEDWDNEGREEILADGEIRTTCLVWVSSEEWGGVFNAFLSDTVTLEIDFREERAENNPLELVVRRDDIGRFSLAMLLSQAHRRINIVEWRSLPMTDKSRVLCSRIESAIKWWKQEQDRSKVFLPSFHLLGRLLADNPPNHYFHLRYSFMRMAFEQVTLPFV